MKNLKEKISKKFKGAKIKDIIIDNEFGNVTATVNGIKNTDCGFIEDYEGDI